MINRGVFAAKIRTGGLSGGELIDVGLDLAAHLLHVDLPVLLIELKDVVAVVVIGALYLILLKMVAVYPVLLLDL